MFNTIIEAQELNQHIDDPAWVVVDCRYDLLDKEYGYKAYLESHIPEAVFADLHDDLSGPPVTDHGRHPLPTPERLEQLFSSLGIARESQVVVYDASSGSFACRLWWMLRYMGHDSVAVLNGGWQAWSAEGLGSEQDERGNRPTAFNGRVHSEWLVSVDKVLSAPLLVDAREPARYRGEQEPIDPVAGHIPGAINHYWRHNLAEDGRFLAPQQLRHIFLDLYGVVPPEQVVFYCGSGVSACHDLFAAVYAGLPVPRLYAGSWSEWCSDPEREIAVNDEELG